LTSFFFFGGMTLPTSVWVVMLLRTETAYPVAVG
jgi:hypothetical protein